MRAFRGKLDGKELSDALSKVKDDNNAKELYLTDVLLHIRPVTVVKRSDPNEAMGVKDRVRFAKAIEVLRKRLLEKFMLSGVTIVDPGTPGGEQAASYGNAGWLSPCSVVPLSMPGLWRNVPAYLADPLGPLAIRWSYLPSLLLWLLRFLRAGASEARLEVAARAMRALVADAPERHRRLAEEAGVAELIQRQGLLYVFPSRADFTAEALAWRLRRDNGVQWIELDQDELRQREPHLARHYTFGVLVEAGAHCRSWQRQYQLPCAQETEWIADSVHAIEQATGLPIEGAKTVAEGPGAAAPQALLPHPARFQANPVRIPVCASPLSALVQSLLLLPNQLRALRLQLLPLRTPHHLGRLAALH